MINYQPDYEALPSLVCDYLHYIDAIKNSLNLVDDPTCGITVDE